MARPENAEIATADDISAACSAIRECVRFIATRNRGTLHTADAEELQRIVAATRRIQTYQNNLRAQASTQYQTGRRNGHISKDGTRSHESLRLVASGEE